MYIWYLHLCHQGMCIYMIKLGVFVSTMQIGYISTLGRLQENSFFGVRHSKKLGGRVSPPPPLISDLFSSHSSSLSSRMCVLYVIMSCFVSYHVVPKFTFPLIYPLTPLVFPDMTRTHHCLCVSVMSFMPLRPAQPCFPIWLYSSIQTTCLAPLQ